MNQMRKSNPGKLRFLTEQEVRDVAAEFGSPTFVYDLGTIRSRYDYFSNLPNAFGLTIRYSVKANPNRTIVKAYDDLGASFDVSSVWEARRVAAAGVDLKPSSQASALGKLAGNRLPWDARQ